MSFARRDVDNILITELDDTPPLVTINAPENGRVYWTSNVPSNSFTVVDDYDPSPVVEQSGYSTAEGTHTYTLSATDASGNVGTASVTYTVERADLSIDVSSNSIIAINAQGTLSVILKHPDGASAPDEIVTFSSNPSGLVFDQGQVTTDTDGKASVMVSSSTPGVYSIIANAVGVDSILGYSLSMTLREVS